MCIFTRILIIFRVRLQIFLLINIFKNWYKLLMYILTIQYQHCITKVLVFFYLINGWDLNYSQLRFCVILKPYSLLTLSNYCKKSFNFWALFSIKTVSSAYRKLDMRLSSILVFSSQPSNFNAFNVHGRYWKRHMANLIFTLNYMYISSNHTKIISTHMYVLTCIKIKF